jgi:hypothetical protein
LKKINSQAVLAGSLLTSLLLLYYVSADADIYQVANVAGISK